MPRRKSRRPSRVRQFLRALVVSATTSFTIASCALNPQLREHAALEPILQQLGVGGLYTAAPVAAPSGEYVRTRFTGCPWFFPGNPPIVPSGPALRELCYDAFAVLHSGSTKTPVFVAQRLNGQVLRQARAVERTDRFFADARLPASERAELDDYRHSGYSRGHMAPAGDMHTAQAMAQSFSLANMAPQDQRHNGGAWSKIENDTRKYVMRAQGDVYVFTGPVYSGQPARIGGRVAVPTHFFKLVHDAGTGRSWVHWQANSAAAQATRPISYGEFVRRTRLHLLPPG